MAGNTVNINLNVQDQSGSVKSRTEDVKRLNSELEKTQKLSTGTKTGARAMARAAALEDREYNRGRGAMGATGASARDFANQAQGLGGLVRLYATYAANVFAVTAAFRALSEAMNTENMVRGLDQLGAATGVAMGGLAKRFAEASGGAISLRESMEATAKAMSSGMSQKQFLVLGEVAKKASQALGVGMGDAVSRLTRGITKLEPELLDELGLFTKVGKATEDYARSVGKSVDNLTDFEKRQAFANAVLKEGIDKFKDIDIPTNPYDKLEASLKNVAQTILEVVNKALVPLVSYLSQSPTALMGVVAGLGMLILKQALPIFSSYRAAMQKATEETAKLAEAKAKSAEKALQVTREARAAELKVELDHIAQVKTEQVDAAEASLKAVSKRGLSKQVQSVLSKPDILSITDKDLAVLDRLGEKQTKVAAQYKLLAAAIREAKTANEQYHAASARAEEKSKAPPAFGTAAYARMQDLETARRQQAGARLVGAVGETVATKGTFAAVGELYQGIKTEKLGLIRGGLTSISGAATIAAGTLSNLASVFSKFLGWLGLATAAFELLDFAFSKNTKELEAFNSALSSGEDAVKAATATYKKFGEQLVPQNIIASAQAFGNLSDSIQSTVDALKAANEKASGWDRFIDGFKTLWGGDLKSKFGESISKQVEAGLKSITDPKLRKEAESQIKSILGAEAVTSEGIESAAKKIDSSKIISKGEDVAKLFSRIAEESKKTAGNLSSVQDGFKALETSYTELANQLIQKDPLNNFGRDLALQGFKLAEVFKDPIAGAAQLRDILGDVSKIKLLSPESQRILVENKQAFTDLSNQLSVYEKQIEASQNKLAEIAKTGMNPRTRARLTGEESAKLQSARAGAEAVQSQMKDLAAIMSKAAGESISKGFEILSAGFNNIVAQQLASNQKALLDMLPKTPETLMMSAKLENVKIDLQIQQIKQTEALIKEMELSRLSAERIHIETQRDEALKSTTETNLRAAISRTSEEKLAPIAKREAILRSTNISKDIKEGKLEKTPETLLEMQRQMGTMSKIAELANAKQMNIIKAQVEGVSAKFEIERKDTQEKLKNNAALEQLYKASEDFKALTLEEQQAVLKFFQDQDSTLNRQLTTLDSRREIETATTIQVLAQKQGWGDIANAAGKAIVTAQGHRQEAEKAFDASDKASRAERDRANTLELMAEKYAKLTIELDKRAKLEQVANQTNLQLLDIQKDSLTQLMEQGKITVDSYNLQIRALELLQLEKQKDAKLNELQATYVKEAINLSQEYAKATSESARTLIQEKLVAISQVYEAEVNGVNKVYAAQKRLKETQENLTERQKAYDDVFKNSMNGMADAIVEFAQTGKFSFKNMVESMLADILRLELRLQAMAFYKSMRESILGLPFIGPSLGATGAGAPVVDSTATQAATTMFGAKGAFFYGNSADFATHKFARGGAFTNSIVSSPTLFKFAQGTGMMGEAGPEAIMPLKRGPDGTLGVRAGSGGGGDTQVVVNNYTSEHAETRESTDSRGNRRIEVIIGDMTANEVTRSGSQAQRSIRNTFGISPQLIRR